MRRVETAEILLDAAEERIRRFGYNGFSFRDLADDAGIKSASVHYHFPTKGELGARVARRYAERFFSKLGEPLSQGVSRVDLVERFVGLFQQSFADKNLMCLCGMLAAEVSGLPPEVDLEVRNFFARNLDWLRKALRGTERADAQATMILAALEGGLMLARALGDPALFDKAAHEVVAAFSQEARTETSGA
jgi:TetR/AcrR family transcriptional repressor of nem operon